MVKTEKKLLLIIILFFASISLITLFNYKLVWWDEAVYIGIGKHIYSSGRVGIFEEIRPLGLPVFLGALWFIGLDPLISGRIFVLLASLLNIYLIYLIGKRIFDSKTAILASLLLAFTPIYYNYSYLLLTGILSTTYALMSIYFFIQKRNLKNISISSFFLGLSFLTRFPQGLVLLCFLIFLFYKKEFKNIFLLLVIFLLTTSPYLIFNYFQYGSIFTPFTKASEIITEYSWLYSHYPLFYFRELFLQNFLFILTIPFFYFFYRERKGTLILLIFIIFIVFFSMTLHKELRYSLVFLPYLCLLSSKGFLSLKLNENVKKILIIFFVFILFFNLLPAIFFTPISYSEKEIEFYSNFTEGDTIYSTTPLLAYFSDAKIVPIYTTLDRAEEFIKKEKPDKVFFVDSFPCNTQECENTKRELINWMKENYNYTYYEEKEYYFFVK